MQREAELHERNERRRGAGVADAAPAGRQRERKRALGCGQHRAQGLGFGAVVSVGSGRGAVEKIDVGGVDPRIGTGPHERGGVGRRIGRKCRGIAAGGGADSADHRVHAIAVPLRIGQSLQHHGGRAFGGKQARLATGVRLHSPARLDRFDRRGRQQLPRIAGEVDPADDGSIQLSAPERPHGQGHRRACGSLLAATGEAGTAEVERAGDAACGDAAERPHRAVGAQRREFGVAGRPAKVVVRGVEVETQADENPGADIQFAPAFALRIATAVVDRFGRHVQHQQLLREHIPHLARRNAEAVERRRERLDEVPGGADRRGLVPAVALRRGDGDGGIGQQERLQLTGGPPRADMRAEADDGDGIGFRDLTPRPLLRSGNWELCESTDHNRRMHIGVARHVLFDEQVGIHPTEPEAADSGAARAFARPIFRTVQKSERAIGVVEVTAGRIEIRLWRKRSVLDREERLRQGRRASSGEQVADGRFHRTDDALTRLPSQRPPQFAHALEFDRIAHRCAGGMAFHQSDIRGLPARHAVGVAHGAQLALAGGCQQVALDVVGNAPAADHRADGVAVALGVVESLQREDARPFADHQAIGIR